MKSSKRSNDKKINLKPKDLKPNKDPRGGGKKFSRPSPDGLTVNHNEMFLAEKNITVKPLKGSSGKKINLNVKDLKTNKDPRGGGKKFSRPSPDGLMNNHNEMFLADVS